MEKISLTDRERSEKVLHRAVEGRNILHTVEYKKANLIGHSLHLNGIVEHAFERKIEESI